MSFSLLRKLKDLDKMCTDKVVIVIKCLKLSRCEVGRGGTELVDVAVSLVDDAMTVKEIQTTYAIRIQ